MHSTQQTKFFLVTLAAIYLIAIFIQSILLLNWDVSWLMLVSRRLLEGGVYGKEFFEINPPMILYLYIPPVLLTKLFPISVAWALRLYVFALASASLFLCYRLGQKIFTRNNCYFFIAILAAIFLVLPTFELGQREHLLIILVMPYFLLSGLRLQNAEVSLGIVIFTGIMAGLGFSIKPYFLITFFGVELYKSIYQRYFFSWMQIETLSIIFIVLAYVASIFLFYPEYLSIIIPAAIENYYQGFGYSWDLLVLRAEFYFCCFAMCAGLFFPSKKQYSQLMPILVIALVGFLLSYLLQRTIWNYHLLAAFSVAIVILALQFIIFVQENLRVSKVGLAEKFFIVALGSILFAFPVHYAVGNTLLLTLGYKKEMSSLINFMHDNAKGKPVYFFTATTVFAFPAVDYSQTIHASKFAFLGWVPGLLRQNASLAKKRYFMNLMVEEIDHNKPVLIFVDVDSIKSNLEDLNFDFISYFSEDEQFRKLWRDYAYFTTLNARIYKFDVYKLIT